MPVLIISTVFSCLVNFLASIYMAEKKNIMAMVTALTGAVTNVVLNLILISRMVPTVRPLLPPAPLWLCS